MHDAMFANCDVVILCGGLGTRLQPIIGERQKSIAPVGGKPFLGRLVDYFGRAGFRKFIFCTGYKKNEVHEYLLGYLQDRPDLSFIFSEEKEPLGTGGALKQALTHATSNTVLVANGDTISFPDFQIFFRIHQRLKKAVTIALDPGKRLDAGAILLAKENKIISFHEKTSLETAGYINAGLYFMEREAAIARMPDLEKFSLEKDFFPMLAKAGQCAGFPLDGGALDIGTPERYAGAEEYLKNRG